MKLTYIAIASLVLCSFVYSSEKVVKAGMPIDDVASAFFENGYEATQLSLRSATHAIACFALNEHQYVIISINKNDGKTFRITWYCCPPIMHTPADGIKLDPDLIIVSPDEYKLVFKKTDQAKAKEPAKDQAKGANPKATKGSDQK